MKKYFKLSVLSMLLFISACSSPSSEPHRHTEEELKMELLLIEQENPLKYLNCTDVKLTLQEKKVKNATLFEDAVYAPDGALLKCVIRNEATLSKFKDIKLEITFYSKTESVITNYTHTIYEYFGPSSTTNIEFKIDNVPPAYHSFSCKVLDATSTN
jgi:hypothetical protein